VGRVFMTGRFCRLRLFNLDPIRRYLFIYFQILFAISELGREERAPNGMNRMNLEFLCGWNPTQFHWICRKNFMVCIDL